VAEVYGERYEVVERVGDGGMATVYRGLDRLLRRDVAIKVMHPHLQSRADARARFSREAQAIARLKHANIVDVYDFSPDGAEQSYLVTEFVHGGTLTKWTHDHGPLFPQSAALLGHAIASALVHAHAAGIVHRDIKPDNLMVSQTGQLKLMDFGIATAMDMEQMTATGAMVGSPAHMAPEQIQGDALDHRCDIFAFGIVLYYLVTRRLPFTASNPHALFRLILEGEYEPASTHTALIDREFDQILALCLARDPSQRYATTQELVQALALYLRRFKMSDTSSLLPRLLQQPEQFQHELRPTLVKVLSEEGHKLALSGEVTGALDVWHRALAFDPSAQGPQDGIARLQRAAARRRWQRHVVLAAAGLLVAGGVVWWAPWQASWGKAAVRTSPRQTAEIRAEGSRGGLPGGTGPEAAPLVDVQALELAAAATAPAADPGALAAGTTPETPAATAGADPGTGIGIGIGLKANGGPRRLDRDRLRRLPADLTQRPPAVVDPLPVASPVEQVKVKVQLGCVPPSGRLSFAGQSFDSGIATIDLPVGEYAFECRFEQTCPACPPVRTPFLVKAEDKVRGKKIVKGTQPAGR
jgi:tRNA A-37 threonylcarbamoyl transferase component Bud32